MAVIAFKPRSQTVTASATSSSSAVALPDFVSVDSRVDRVVRLVNVGAVEVFFEFGRNDQVVASATTSMSLPSGMVDVVTAPFDSTHIAVVTATGSSGLRVTLGEGL